MSRKNLHSINVNGSIAIALLVTMSACSGSDAGTIGGSGGANATSGGNPGTGGVASTAGSMSTGGTPSTGGLPTTGGGAPSAGGSSASGGTAIIMIDTGGATSGGAPSSGGTATSGGSKEVGGAPSTGGSQNTAGTFSTGGAKNTGGMVGTGGAKNSGGSIGTGGATGGTGGSSSSGGVIGTGGSTSTNSACPGADASEFALVQAWLNNTTAVGALPSYAYSNIKTNFPAGAAFNKLACTIAMSCVEFAPMESNWLRKCEAVLTSAIVAESSYNPSSVVTDSYATRAVSGVTANDPTVGLLQIRFSSTVHDYNYYGPTGKMAAIGCNWPSALTSQADTATFWATAGGTTYLSFMQDVSCNIALAAWYYFYNATGNGGSSAVWISNYCGGQGVAGTMVVGLLSHLQGGSYTRPPDANNAYPWGIECCACGNPSGCTCTGCTGRFAAFMGIGTSSSRPSPDPFQEALAPEPTKYCK